MKSSESSPFVISLPVLHTRFSEKVRSKCSLQGEMSARHPVSVRELRESGVVQATPNGEERMYTPALDVAPAVEGSLPAPGFPAHGERIRVRHGRDALPYL